MQRDVKYLYARALRGEVKSLTGLSDPYEPPLDAQITVHTDQQTPRGSVQAIIQGLVRLGYLSGKALQSLRRPAIPASADIQTLS
jgi:adenylylsulfate kinase-like enzyme